MDKEGLVLSGKILSERYHLEVKTGTDPGADPQNGFGGKCLERSLRRDHAGKS